MRERVEGIIEGKTEYCLYSFPHSAYPSRHEARKHKENHLGKFNEPISHTFSPIHKQMIGCAGRREVGREQEKEKQVKSRTQKYFWIIDFLFGILFSLPISIQSKIRTEEKTFDGFTRISHRPSRNVSSPQHEAVGKQQNRRSQFICLLREISINWQIIKNGRWGQQRILLLLLCNVD